MADKSFGVKELNLLNASGTPTVTSPNNLNLNANTVAISTSCTIGNNLTVTSTTNSANLNVTGIGTLTRAFATDLFVTGISSVTRMVVADNITGIGTITSAFVTDLSVSGVTTITVPANANPHSSWDVVNNSASAYRFTGPGQDGAEDNPDIYLVRGQRYVFKMNASGHPFQIRVSNGGSAYSDGVTNNGSQTGNVVFNVQHDAPAHLFYQCTSHSSMVGNIYIVGQHLANGANDRIITATSAYGMNGESALTYTNNILKNEVSDSSGLGAHILVNNSESSAGISLLGSGSSFSSGGWAAVTDAGIIRSSANASNGLVLQAASGDLKFYAGGNPPAERLRITSAGRIGINETSPNATLHIKSADGANNRLELVHQNDAASEQNQITFKNNTTQTAYIVSGKDGSNNNIGLLFGTGTTDRLNITSTGAALFTNGIQIGVDEGSSTSGGLLIHRYSSTSIDDGVDFTVTITFPHSNTGAFMVECFSGHSHYRGSIMYYKVVGMYGASTNSGGGVDMTAVQETNTNTISFSDTSNATQRTNGDNYNVALTARSGLSNTGTSLKSHVHVYVHSRITPVAVTIA
jgi:hypothetical protein